MTSTLPDAEEEERTAQVRMEESFTIHLGNSNMAFNMFENKLACFRTD